MTLSAKSPLLQGAGVAQGRQSQRDVFICQMLENGVGVEKNGELAQEWYHRAEAAGYIP